MSKDRERVPGSRRKLKPSEPLESGIALDSLAKIVDLNTLQMTLWYKRTSKSRSDQAEDLRSEEDENP